MVILIEVISETLLNAVQNARLPVEDAAILRANMLRKRKINLPIFICGVAIFPLCLLEIFLSRTAGASILPDFAHKYSFLIYIGFGGLMIGLLAANKYFGIAGAYLKALRAAYPDLPERKPIKNYGYHIIDEYYPND